MAGDWIKMRIGLADDPAVIALACATKVDVDTVVGKLHRIWGWADQNTTDGRLEGVPASWLDNKVGKKGFADAMTKTNPPWLVIDDTGITIPNFHRHNGDSAKSRAENSKRQSVSRNSRDKGATNVTKSDDKSATREEKRREELIAPPSDGDWTAARQKANELTTTLGKAFHERDRRLLLGVAYLSQGDEFDLKWLEVAERETKAARPEKPYAFFQKVVTNLAEDHGWNLKSSISVLEIPAELLERRKQPC